MSKPIHILMAPLEGVTDRVYRGCFYDHFPGLKASLTPFLPIPDRVQRVSSGNLGDVCFPGNSNVYEIPQLLLSEADSFLLAIDALQKRGFSEVNWNLGCPSRGVIKKGKGAGLMPRTSHILEVLDKVLARTDIQISLKLRMGLYESEELFRLLPSLRDYPLNRVILHPRLGTQMYTGSVDLDGFQKALDLYGKQICYNGDINTGLDFLALQKRFPSVDEWMIGRGLVANPFLLKEILQFNEVSGCSGDQLENPFKQKAFYDFLEDLYGRIKEKITRKEAFWNYFKGILIYSFSHSYIPPEKRKELFRIRIEEDWFQLKNSLQLLYLDQ